MKKRFLAVLLTVVMAFSAIYGAEGCREVFAATRPYATHGRLSVKGTRLVDKNGKTVRLQGISTHGLAWFPQYVNKAAFKTLRDKWNVNLIRLAMYTAEYGGYTSGGKANMESLVENGVKYASSLGMYVIIDWHILSDGNPLTHQSEAVDFFTRMAKKYKNNGHVIYEICNEPNGCEWKDVKEYANKVIPAIRKYDKKAVILVGSTTWSQDLDKVADSPLKYKKNIMYTCHFYAATHKQWLRDRVSAAIKKGIPVFISEFSICDASGNGAIDKAEADAWMKFIKKNNISCVAWALDNKAETCSLIKADCAKTSGWKNSDLTDTGKYIKKAYTAK